MAQNPYSGKPAQDEFLRAAEKAGHPAGSILGYPEIDAIVGSGTRPWWLINAKEHRAGRGKFLLPAIGSDDFASAAPSKASASKPKKASKPKLVVPEPEVVVAPAAVAAPDSVKLSKIASIQGSAIPARSSHFIPFGHFKDITSIFESEMFYPLFVTGLSGNGKTFMIEQAASKAERELFRVNITIETDEDDLLGGFRLVDGETRWFDGPVVEAMRRGAVLLLDEVDLASNKIMCLQPVLEGKPILLKKINEIVAPAKGFTIAATANTKGKGSEDGRFIGTNVLNEAFLERFAICFEQDYPVASVETRIISDTLRMHGAEDPDRDFAKKLVAFARQTRDAFKDGACDELIATRRLEHIAKAFAIFGDRKKAVQLAMNRFDDETKADFISLWDKIDAPAEDEETLKNGDKSEAAASDSKPSLSPF